MTEPYHTPHWHLVRKVWYITLPFCLAFMLAFCSTLSEWLAGFFGSIVGVAGLMYGISIILRLVNLALVGDNPIYQDFIDRGGDPFFDWHLGWSGVNPHPITEYHFFCNSCGTLNPEPHGYCRHCGSNLSNNPQQQQSQPSGRLTTCWNCHQQVQEWTWGDLDNGGVVCPFCNSVIVAAK